MHWQIIRVACALPGVIIASTLVFVFQTKALAQTQLTQIATNQGMLSIRQGRGNDCYNCQGLYLNGKQILSDQYVTLDSAYPSFQNPQLIAVSLSAGGNCCSPTRYMLDFSVKPHLTVKGVGFDKDIARSEHGVIFTQTEDTDALGDRLLSLYEYEWGSGEATLKKKTPKYTLGPLTQKEYPDDVLSDPIMRQPLLQLIGGKYYSTFRMHTAVAEKVKVIDGRYVIGAGCQPHDCPSNFAMFIIDTQRKLAWAAEGTENEDRQKSARVWGKIGKKDTLVLKELVQWLATNEIPGGLVTRVSLPDPVSKLYEARGSGHVEPSVKLDSSGKVNVSAATIPLRTDALSPVELFKLLAPSIYVVHATQTNGDEFQGSAVAVSSTALLTNCHVVNGSSSITMSQDNKNVDVGLLSANVDADRCVLKSETPLGHYVSVRPFGDLKVGERVYSIGAPAGLELTMTDGLLSGKRLTSGQHFVQTSAPISHGSSGGGLFDEAGNLIGITTFQLKGSENLNFAISPEDYLLH